MKKFEFAVDYRKFRISKLNTEEFSHLKLLLFWPIFGIFFGTIERLVTLDYNMIYSPVDDMIPFCEFFVIPYYFWFVFLIGMLLYSMLYNIDTFKRYMMFIIVTYSIAMVTYIVYPNAQELRPVSFERDNIFTDIVTKLYNFDTNTNVCPSIHVLGSFAVLFAAWRDKNFASAGWRIFFVVSTILITVSTVFLKQHSIIDIVAALVLCAVVYPIFFRKKAYKNKVLSI